MSSSPALGCLRALKHCNNVSEVRVALANGLQAMQRGIKGIKFYEYSLLCSYVFTTIYDGYGVLFAREELRDVLDAFVTCECVPVHWAMQILSITLSNDAASKASIAHSLELLYRIMLIDVAQSASSSSSSSAVLVMRLKEIVAELASLSQDDCGWMDQCVSVLLALPDRIANAEGAMHSREAKRIAPAPSSSVWTTDVYIQCVMDACAQCLRSNRPGSANVLQRVLSRALMRGYGSICCRTLVQLAEGVVEEEESDGAATAALVQWATGVSGDVCVALCHGVLQESCVNSPTTAHQVLAVLFKAKVVQGDGLASDFFTRDVFTSGKVGAEEELHAVVQLLHACGKSTLYAALEKVAMVWSFRATVEHSTRAQHGYLTMGLLKLLGSPWVTKEWLVDSSVLRNLMNGVQCRLGNNLRHIHFAAVKIAKRFAAVVTPEQKMTMQSSDDEEEYDQGDENVSSDSMGKSKNEVGSVTSVVVDLHAEAQNTMVELDAEEEEEEDPDALWVPDAAASRASAIADDEESDESEDDDGLQPYSLEDDDSDLRNVKHPTYLRQVLDYFEQKDSHEHWEAALDVCEVLVRQQRTDLSEVAARLTKDLLHLTTRTVQKNYDSIRIASLVALAAMCPQIVVPTLAELFFSNSRTVGQRLEVLSVLERAARELGGTDESAQGGIDKEKQPPRTATLLENKEQVVEKETNDKQRRLTLQESRAIVQKRIESNSRRWGSAVRRDGKDDDLQANGFEKGRVNHLGQHVALFCVPFASQIDRRPEVFSSFGGVECSVLSATLTYLGVLVRSCGTHIANSAVSKVVLHVALAHRGHANARVRFGSLFAVMGVLSTLPWFVTVELLLADNIMDVVAQWLMGLMDSEPDVECRRVGRACLQLLSDILEQQAAQRGQQTNSMPKQQSLKYSLQ